MPQPKAQPHHPPRAGGPPSAPRWPASPSWPRGPLHRWVVAGALGLSCAVRAAEPALCPGEATLAEVALPLINAARAQARPCGADGRLLPAAPALSWHPVLARTTQHMAQALAERNQLRHDDGSGLPLGARLQRGGYAHAAAAENIAGGPTSVPAVLDAWLTSPAHCAALMRADVHDVGLACVARADSSYLTHWVLHLGAPLR